MKAAVTKSKADLTCSVLGLASASGVSTPVDKHSLPKVRYLSACFATSESYEFYVEAKYNVCLH